MAVERDTHAGPRDDRARPGPDIGLTISLETYNAAVTRHRAMPGLAGFHHALALELNAQLAAARFDCGRAERRAGTLHAELTETQLALAEVAARRDELAALFGRALDDNDGLRARNQTLSGRCRALRRRRLPRARFADLTAALVMAAAMLVILALGAGSW